MNKWFTDKAVTLATLVANHEALIAEEQEVDLDLKYSGNKHADNTSIYEDETTWTSKNVCKFSDRL